MLTDDAQNPRQLPTKDNIVSVFFLPHLVSILNQVMTVDQRNAVACTRGCTKRLSFLPLWVLSLSRKQYYISHIHFKTLAMVVRLKIWTEMKMTVTTKVDTLPFRVDWQLMFWITVSVIYPVDYETNGHIVDDLMHEIMVRPLPPGCRMTAIFDASIRPAGIVELEANFSLYSLAIRDQRLVCGSVIQSYASLIFCFRPIQICPISCVLSYPVPLVLTECYLVFNRRKN